MLEVCWDGLWTLSFGLSQFRGHGSWLVCEVVLTMLYHVWGPAWIEIHRNSIWLRARSHTNSHHNTLEGPWPHFMILEVCWDGLWTLSFKLSQLCGHDSWLVCEATLIMAQHVWGPAWLEIHWSSIWLRVRSHMTSHHITLEGPWPHYMVLCTLSFGHTIQSHGAGFWMVWFWRCVGMAFGHCLLGSHNTIFHGAGCWVVWF